MKLHSHTKFQIVSLILLIAIFVFAVLYSRGHFDFTFINRPNEQIGSLTSVDNESGKTEQKETDSPEQQSPESTIDMEAFEEEFNKAFEEFFNQNQP